MLKLLTRLFGRRPPRAAQNSSAPRRAAPAAKSEPPRAVSAPATEEQPAQESGSAIWRGRLASEFDDFQQRLPAKYAASVEVLRAQLAGLWAGDMPRLPGGAADLLGSCQQDDVPIDALIRSSERDPALAALVLRTANSVAYRGESKCRSLREAIVRIGRRGLANVATRYAVTTLTCEPGPRYQPYLDAVFEHLVQTGALCREVAVAYRVDKEEAYTLGLMHDIGKVMVCEGISRARRELRADPNLPHALVAELMRGLHEPLGALTIEAWNMPSAVAQRVAGHHAGPADESDPLGEVLRLGDRIHLACCNGHAWAVEAALVHRNPAVSPESLERAVRSWQFDAGMAA